MQRLALINKDRDDFQYNNRDLVYIILPLTSQLKTASRKVSIKYVGPLAVYKIVDPQLLVDHFRWKINEVYLNMRG